MSNVSAKRTLGPSIALALLVLALALFPVVAPLFDLDYYTGFVRRLMIVALAAASLNFLMGRVGLVALGHAGFVGVGAYAVAALAEAGFGSAWLVWALALVAGVVVSALIGAVALRTRGVYFIMITLAFAQMLFYLAVSLRAYGGDDGYTLYTPLQLLGGENPVIASGAPLYWVVLAIVALVLPALWRLEASHFGRALEGIRDNETRMQALGYPTYRLKLCAFAAAGGVASLAGALMATQNGFVSPSLMHWTQSALLIVMVVIGGVGRRWGAPLGVAVWLVFEELLKQFTEYWHAPMGLLLIGVVFLAPKGLAALASRRAAP
ncbi:branched-chain amino acid ABC transporter permease [Comamonas endophytica]|uniref:Branched-chain amino acid ABC transporter permease n=1 Tax=Comamonas endophytica TaxID=2949090 RepID=A0ABY6G8L6_9BURK|nr:MULTISPECIES: branched-chain amino acid ABC transporter permease [unclassified Acidovorax]MCD2511418.1 branched-chain amino acid ABC transporter permease [Acidovorax sp. D4N7]UYG50809.1 branched-chain amino acid ABC transporter permease [Acidovorax sp. 5MLIR]